MQKGVIPVDSNILHLTLKRKWFNMILGGEKKEEYREVKHYWIKRLTNQNDDGSVNGNEFYKRYDVVEFRNGYGENVDSFQIECKGIKIGPLNNKWCDDWQNEVDVFVITLGKLIRVNKILLTDNRKMTYTLINKTLNIKK